uniref:Lysosomal dipeptide transporter MFSD1 n=2 Tax=Ditylum brightwellii TaxID=49249 RepID=A0A6U3WEK3_9STRA|mmetsp:Transcript_34483/g.46185  ORF Transcript_34483/g.46185 Transcript_34483/m.46185 type:complete len:583 (+) Transcript_34483:102-1850(+)
MTNFNLGLRAPRKRSSLRTRWLVLILVSVTISGVYYSFDIPAALHQQLLGYMPPSNKFEIHFNLLYSLYSLPNVILPFFGGNIVDRIGAPICLIAFASLGFLGQLLFAIGTSAKSWGLMLFGRFVYGLGGESICVAQSALLSRWFEGGELALSFGVALSVSRLGSVFNNMISPALANSSSTPSALWVGFGVNAVTVLLALAIAYIDKKASAKCKEDNQTTEILTQALLDREEIEEGPLQVDSKDISFSDDDTVSTGVPHLSDVKRFGSMFWLLSLSCLVVYGCVLPFNNVASGLLLERNYFTPPPADCHLTFPDQCTSGSLMVDGKTNPSFDTDGNVCPADKSTTAPVLPTSLNITTTESSWKKTHYVFESVTATDVDCGDKFWSDACTKDYCDAQKRATEKAGRIMSIPYFISAGLSPLLGFVVDNIGNRAIIASIAPLMLTAVHIQLATRSSSPVLPLIGQGIAYSLFASVLWPSVPLVVEKKLTGTAFGVITVVQNIGLVLLPLIIAAVYNHDGNRYIPNVEYVFITCAVFGLIVGVLINVLDCRTGNRLNNPSGEPDDDDNSEPVSQIVTMDDGCFIS